ncbi:hypothetical protein M430DRAFT_39852 [Amorphotheca resinae ATCC 22711]|jgi:hypothetical protein|uniref:Uncharacterized protein n=1 Tax=Amorphotheca resinae ATCC 22711 TaxID=857342 RepID=A0A2T3BBW2_AMORE|nr:hypothetical protein M430DRAFT_39852 [Amorphotheca resinae ATCC 22711]PSS25816.1 hypothetical protein M430DRAFT_39852 [Amorphotheca resinae ATCC 22711]
MDRRNPLFCCQTVGIVREADGLCEDRTEQSTTLSIINELSSYALEILIFQETEALLDTIFQNPRGKLLELKIWNHIHENEQPARFIFHQQDKDDFNRYLEFRSQAYLISSLFKETGSYVKVHCGTETHSDRFTCTLMAKRFMTPPPWPELPPPPITVSSPTVEDPPLPENSTTE